MEVVHGVGLHGVVSFHPKPNSPRRLCISPTVKRTFSQSVRAEIAVAHNPLGIAAAAVAQFGAAGDHEGRHGGLGRPREAERIK